jgi:hypothetical protein
MKLNVGLKWMAYVLYTGSAIEKEIRMLISLTFPYTIYTNYRIFEMLEMTPYFQACLISNEPEHWKDLL